MRTNLASSFTQRLFRVRNLTRLAQAHTREALNQEVEDGSFTNFTRGLCSSDHAALLIPSLEGALLLRVRLDTEALDALVEFSHVNLAISVPVPREQ